MKWLVPTEAYHQLGKLLPANCDLKLIGNQLQRGTQAVVLRPQVAAAAVYFITNKANGPSDLAAIKAAVWNKGPLLETEILNIQKVISDLNNAMQKIGMKRDFIRTIRSPLGYHLDAEAWLECIETGIASPPPDDTAGRTPHQFAELLDLKVLRQLEQ